MVVTEKEEVVKKKHFKGTILITDPCYITHPSDWVLSGYGSKMRNLGITTYMTHDTLYGDWGCTTYETETKRPLGEFCADAGLVSVFLMDEVLKYNPEISNWVTEHPWCATVIQDFDGDVEFVIVHREGTLDETADYWNKGDPGEDDILIVRGTGNVNFFTSQTSL